MAKKTWLVCGLVAGALLVLTGCGLTRFGYESPDYKVVSSSGPFEIRDYPAMTLAATPIEGGDSGNDSGFRRLFGYISGKNESESKISMTVPVFMDMDGTNRSMSFVVPEKVAEAGPPKPSEESVIVERRAAGLHAVFRFRGSWEGKKGEAARAKLEAWIAEMDLQPAGPVWLAAYDPPFTPPFLRRNEILAPLASKTPAPR